VPWGDLGTADESWIGNRSFQSVRSWSATAHLYRGTAANWASTHAIPTAITGCRRQGNQVNDLEYEVLAWLAAGNSVFRPREATHDAEEAFRGAVQLLGVLRDRGLVDYRDEHVTKTESGIYLVVGPVQLTPAGKDALEPDLRLGPRPPRPDKEPSDGPDVLSTGRFGIDAAGSGRPAPTRSLNTNGQHNGQHGGTRSQK
jgi:hypothetical protein